MENKTKTETPTEIKLHREAPGHYAARRTVTVDGRPVTVTLQVLRYASFWTAQITDSSYAVRFSARVATKADGVEYIRGWISRAPWRTWPDGSWVTA